MFSKATLVQKIVFVSVIFENDVKMLHELSNNRHAHKYTIFLGFLFKKKKWLAYWVT